MPKKGMWCKKKKRFICFIQEMLKRLTYLRRMQTIFCYQTREHSSKSLVKHWLLLMVKERSFNNYISRMSHHQIPPKGCSNVYDLSNSTKDCILHSDNFSRMPECILSILTSPTIQYACTRELKKWYTMQSRYHQ